MSTTAEQDIENLTLAYQAARSSPDPSTQNGAVIITRSGSLFDACNDFPFGVKNKPERLDRPLKYSYIEHAERAAIYRAIGYGVDVRASKLYVPWFACADCARAIIACEIVEVIGHKQMFDGTPGRWKDSIEAAFEMFEEAGIKTRLYDGKLGLPAIRFNGELWEP